MPTQDHCEQLAAWSPTHRDPRLLRERKGRWRWPYVLAGTILVWIPVLAFVALFPDDTDNALTPGNLAGYGAALLLGVALMGLMHGRAWLFAMAYSAPFRWVDFFKAAAALLLVAALVFLRLVLMEPSNLSVKALSLHYVLWLALGVGTLLVQTLGEEVLFRGYLLRVWGALQPRRLFVVTPLLLFFVSLHLVNNDVVRDPAIGVLTHVLSEGLAYVLLMRTGSLAAPWGLHWMNNTWSAILPETPGQPLDFAVVVYADPVLSAGGTHSSDPWAWTFAIVQCGLLAALLLWHRSPLYIAPAPALPTETATAPADMVPVNGPDEPA